RHLANVRVRVVAQAVTPLPSVVRIFPHRLAGSDVALSIRLERHAPRCLDPCRLALAVAVVDRVEPLADKRAAGAGSVTRSGHAEVGNCAKAHETLLAGHGRREPKEPRAVAVFVDREPKAATVAIFAGLCVLYPQRCQRHRSVPLIPRANPRAG